MSLNKRKEKKHKGKEKKQKERKRKNWCNKSSTDVEKKTYVSLIVYVKMLQLLCTIDRTEFSNRTPVILTHHRRQGFPEQT